MILNISSFIIILGLDHLTANVVSVALIGSGHWGQNLARVFSELGSLAAICDVDEVRGQEIADKCSVPFRDIESILDDEKIDAIVIASPAVTHFEIAKRALNAGKHAFVEKPLALDSNEANELCELAEERALILMVGHLMQYHPAFLKLCEMCESGRLGRIRHVYSNRLNFGRFRTEENILWSFAPHDISMILKIIDDEPISVSAFGHALTSNGIQDMTTTNMEFSNGAFAHVYVSWLHPFKEQRFVVVGENAMAVLDDGQDWPEKLAIYDHNVEWSGSLNSAHQLSPEWVHVDAAEPLKIEAQHFIDSVTYKTEPKTNGWEGLRVLKVLNKAQQSLDAGAVKIK